MTFTEKLKAAGFDTQADFARHIGRGSHTVSRWVRNGAPAIIHLYLDLRIRVREIGDG